MFACWIVDLLARKVWKIWFLVGLEASLLLMDRRSKLVILEITLWVLFFSLLTVFLSPPLFNLSIVSCDIYADSTQLFDTRSIKEQDKLMQSGVPKSKHKVTCEVCTSLNWDSGYKDFREICRSKKLALTMPFVHHLKNVFPRHIKGLTCLELGRLELDVPS